MASYLLWRLTCFLRKELSEKQVCTHNTLILWSAQAVLVTALIGAPSSKRKNVVINISSQLSSINKGLYLCFHTNGIQITAQKKAKTKMDAQPKNRDERTKGYFKKTALRQQKCPNTLERWLVRPLKISNVTEESSSQEGVGMADDVGFQISPTLSLDEKDAEKLSISDIDEETQPLTPQNLDHPQPQSAAATVSGFSQKNSHDEEELEKQAASSSEGSAKKRIKITDFFSWPSSQRLPVKRRWPDVSSEEADRGKKIKPAHVKWMGTPISELNRIPECGGTLPPLNGIPGQHTVLIRTDLLKKDEVPVPYPSKFIDIWDNIHVKMPCSSKNTIPVEDQVIVQEPQHLESKSQWEQIKKTLTKKPTNVDELTKAILKHSAFQAKNGDTAALHSYCTKVLDPDAVEHLFDSLLPDMMQLALRVSELCTKPIPLLKRGVSHSITMSQEQVACLLANAFFCTFPQRDIRECCNYPDFNFFRLFKGSSSKKMEKLKTLMCYFKMVTQQIPTGLVTFSRRKLEKPLNWKSSKTLLTKLHITCEGTIEDDGYGMLQVDFANKFVGGGVIGAGLVQEEIRFLINPELIVSRLFTEALDDDECLVVTGTQQFSKYTGYNETYKWSGSFQDKTPRDAWQRMCTEIVAIDALKFEHFLEQFHPSKINRELNKAFCGFRHPEEKSPTLAAVATGNWGCGVFGGDTRLKALIQMLAAAEAGRDVAYFTFGDSQLMTDVYNMHSFLTQRNISVGRLLRGAGRVQLRFGQTTHHPLMVPCG
ncbi:poly(ADP-ribose) glycohydrolase isoform X3 [Nothobranchius furzeri]|uniref:poly(ADP-ribose) glycohydrolase isoform X3 n=1 Tax=Nothobranchius furzeri TaxID=105023 RepID=UPI0039047422